ncbi:MAG: SAM hydroxide adenosyltransferase, partial [Stellaceae bacterium]
APERHPEWPDDLAQIVYVDHYGNALTGLRGESLSPTMRLAAGGHTIAHAPTFSAIPPGEAFWYVNSNGLIEIAVNAGRADRALDLAIGSEIAILE